MPGGHGVQQLTPAKQYPDARRAVDFVTRENIKIGAQGLHIDPLVRHGLRAIHQHQGAGPVGQLSYLLNGRNGANGIRAVSNGHQPSPG